MLTSSKKVPNSAQNKNGPAKSASSIMWLSILAIGFSTTSVYHNNRQHTNPLIIFTLIYPPFLHSVQHTFILICAKFTPNSSSNGGSPSYPSVPNAANHPVLNPPCPVPICPVAPG